MQYHGILVLNESLTQALAEGRETRFGDTCFVTPPRFETGHPRYAWLNAVVPVAERRVLPRAVEHRVHQVVNG